MDHSRRRKSNTTTARSKRVKRVLLNSKSTAPPERIIMSTSSLEELLNLTSCHSEECEDATFSVDLSSTHPSVIKVTCRECEQTISCDKDGKGVHNLPLFDAIAAGALCSGLGYLSIKTLLCSMEVKMMSKEAYYAAEERVAVRLKQAVSEEFHRAGEEEKKLALEAGATHTVNGVEYPFIKVVGDGGWGKRSYGHGGSSNSGVGVIIGERTKKLLFVGTRTKRCIVCNKQRLCEDGSPVLDIPEHDCSKNWSGTSQAMEADIIVQGFRESLDHHGLIYRYLIADADSSVYSRIQTSVVYPGKMAVEKIDCLNHGVRGLNTTIYSIIKNTAYQKSHRDTIEAELNRYGKDVKAAVRYNNEHQSDSPLPTSALSLAQDLMNIPLHIHGHHKECRAYFCKNVGDISTTFNGISQSAAFLELKAAFHRLANRAHRLIFNVTSNFAECFMSVMAKTTAGKRMDFPQSYARRANSAALSYNCGAFWLPKVFPSVSNNQIWEKTARYFDETNRGKKKTRDRAQSGVPSDADAYGVSADPGESTEEELKTGIQNLIDLLQVSSLEERDAIERATVGQGFNPRWKHEKRYRSTASTSGRIFTFADWNDNSNILKDTCYPRDLSFLPNVINGINLEPEAKRLYSSMNNDVPVEECGLHVYRKNGVLAASPDGLLPNNGILEVKCVNCPPSDIPKRPDNFLIHEDKKNPKSPLMLRKSHKYYRQIVMQLHVCEKDYCDFFVLHKPKDPNAPPVPPFQQTIRRNAETKAVWDEMERKLLHFWMNDQAPEHVNPRYPYTKQFRTPKYRAEAMAQKKKEREEEEERKSRPRLSKDDLSASYDVVISQVIGI